MPRKLKLVHSRSGRGSLYFIKEDTGIVTDLPVENGGGGAYTDPRLEVDFYALDCKKLGQLRDDMTSYLSTVRLIPSVAAYYNDKMAQLESAIQAKCGGGIKPLTETMATDDPTPAPTTPPVTVTPSPTPNGLPGVTVNVGDTSGMNPVPGASSGGGSGGGGGEGGSKKPAAKKTNWLLWALCIGAFGLSLYKGRNTTIKMPG